MPEQLPDTLRRTTEHVARVAAAGGPVTASGALLLLRRYVRTSDPALRDALASALTWGIEASASDPLWIEPLAEAMPCAEDDRIVAAIHATALALPHRFAPGVPLRVAMRCIEAAFRAVLFVPAPALLEQAVDRLEQCIGAAYEPGLGMAGASAAPDQQLEIDVGTAAALLSGHDVTGRLPYGMLAEELARRALTSIDEGGEQSAALAGVLLGLARLHSDPEYSAAAVVAPAADYRADAARLLDASVARADPVEGRDGAHERRRDPAALALAIDEYLAASNLQ